MGMETRAEDQGGGSCDIHEREDGGCTRVGTGEKGEMVAFWI